VGGRMHHPPISKLSQSIQIGEAAKRDPEEVRGRQN